MLGTVEASAFAVLDARSSGVKGRSSIGRAAVSKTASWGFESLRPCFNVEI